jgi:H+/Cl- antiporter ClcA
MNTNKEGVSVKDIESFAKQHKFELFFCLMFILAAAFSFFSFFRAGWSIVLAAIGGVIGVLVPARIELFGKKLFQFVFKQEQMVQLVLGVVGLILSIFLPQLIFLLLGLHGGKHLYHLALEINSQSKQP